MNPKNDSLGSPPPARVEARVQQQLYCTSEQLFDAWLDPSMIRQWMANSLKTMGLAGDIKRIETDPRVGGKFCFSDMRNGTEAIHVGSYLELDRPRKIVFTWMVGKLVEEAEKEPNPSQLTITIEPAPKGCEVAMVHEMDAQWAEYVARTEASWTRMLKSIESLYEVQ